MTTAEHINRVIKDGQALIALVDKLRFVTGGTSLVHEMDRQLAFLLDEAHEARRSDEEERAASLAEARGRTAGVLKTLLEKAHEG